MPRPKLHSDETILDAAKNVLKRRGPTDFTLKDVADEVGISRAALIQRFTNRETLLRHVMRRAVVLTEQHLASIPVERSVPGLREFLAELCKVMGRGQGFEVNLLIAWYEVSDPELRRLADQRFGLVKAAIAARIPSSCSLPAAQAANLLHAVISGATMQWVVSKKGRLDHYILAQLELAVERLFVQAESLKAQTRAPARKASQPSRRAQKA